MASDLVQIVNMFASLRCVPTGLEDCHHHEATLKKEQSRHITNEQLQAHIKSPVFFFFFLKYCEVLF